MELDLARTNWMHGELTERLQALNGRTERFGLALTQGQIEQVAQARDRALEETGRVEFGRSIVPDLLEAFSDSVYLTPEDYFETALELIDAFYYFKGELDGYLSDEELIEVMRRYFDGVCQGSLEYLRGTTLSDLCRELRAGRD